MRWHILTIFLFYFRSTLAYKAAVYEHVPSSSDSPKDTILKNVNEYRDFSDRAKEQSAEILVFPEYGLTGIVENPEDYSIEISNDNDVIKELRAIASERQTYVVVNVLEKEKQDGKTTKYYNTNLVFDRLGAISLKYRKINLFQEPHLTPGDANQTLSFSTDFGVTFGILTGSDILHANPSQRVFNDTKVTDVVYPTSFAAVMPFLTPLSLQYGYSVANGVNLLAAAYDRPKESRGGSGIYLADGKIAETYISATSSSKPLIQDVTKVDRRTERTTCSLVTPYGLPGQINKTTILDYVTLNDFPKSGYIWKNLDLSSNTSTSEICHRKFCCTFDFTINTTASNSSAVYKLAAYNDYIEYKDFKGHISACSLLVCENDSTDSCGARVNASTHFMKISVESTVEKEEGAYFRPMSLSYDLQPIATTTFCFNGSTIQFRTLKPQEEVLVFGIFGSVSAASSVHGVLFLVILSILTLFY